MQNVKKEKNIGLCILRIWMCFEVVLIHCWDTNTPGVGIHYILYRFKPFAVSVFMFMSLYLTADVFYEGGVSGNA